MANLIHVELSSHNMGEEADERDFDLWTQYVAQNIKEKTGLTCEVTQAGFGEGVEDLIWGANEEQRATLRTWLRVDGWNDFCGEVWEEMRKLTAH